MSTTRAELHDLVERLPDAEILAARRFLEFLSEESVGPVFAESIRTEIAQTSARETIVCRSCEDMSAKPLGNE
jgi:hypothetical protein